MHETNPSRSAPRFSWQRWWPVLLVAALAFGVFANSLQNEFIYDDWLYIVNNPYIRSWSNLWEMIDPTSTYHQTYVMLSYRPLLDLSHLVTYQLFGLNAGGHHLFNITLHALSAAVVLVVLRRLTRDETVALVGALVFAVHPIHMQAVQVSGLRADVLATPLFLAAILCHLRLRDRPDKAPFVWAGLAAGSYFLSLTAKEAGATLPLVVLFLDARRGGLKTVLNREGMRPYIGYAAVAALYGWLRFGLFTNIHQGASYLGGSPLAALLTTGRIFAAYIDHLLFPFSFRPRYLVTPSAGLDAATAGAWALLAALAAAAYLARRRQPIITLGLVWLALTLLPVTNIVPIRNPMADRYLYLPSVGFCAIVGWVMVESSRAATKRWGINGKRAATALGAAVLVAWASLTWKQNTLWHDEVTLWSEVLRLEPESRGIRLSLGVSLGRKGQYAEAEEMLQASIRRWPDEAEAYYSLGIVYTMQGKNEQASKLFRETIRRKPSHSEALSRLATLEAASAGSGEAIERARASILADPSFPQGHYHLGLLYQSHGMRDRAKAAYREAIRLSPEFAKALNNLGIILASEGDLGEAEEALRRAVAADPRYARAHLNLANLYLKRNSPDEALPHLEAVVRLEPDHPRIDQIRSFVSRIRQDR